MPEPTTGSASGSSAPTYTRRYSQYVLGVAALGSGDLLARLPDVVRALSAGRKAPSRRSGPLDGPRLTAERPQRGLQLQPGRLGLGKNLVPLMKVEHGHIFDFHLDIDIRRLTTEFLP